MFLNILGRDKKQRKLDLPSDYRMDELFCDINGIGEEVSDEEVHEQMSLSEDGIVDQTGRNYCFSDYSAGDVTLAKLGIGGDENMYHFASGIRHERISGGRSQ